MAALCAIVCSLLLLSACGGGGSGSTSGSISVTQQTPPTSQGGSKPAPKPGGGRQGGNAAPIDLANPGPPDSANFGVPTASSNRFLPLKPGTQTVREGSLNVGYRTLPHRVVTTVTDVSKEVNGISTVLVLDQDYDGGQISEQSLDYLAEDREGNVWYVGSYTESYEGGQFVNASDAWLDGINGAQAGILMPADPKTGTPAFTEDTVPGVEAPTAQVDKTGLKVSVPFKSYRDVLSLQEGSEHKYFAPGLGQIKTEPPPSGGPQEIENLVNLTQLSPAGLAKISSEVLKLDRHAAVAAPDVFGNASPAKRSL
jgi:hypothetical protein